MPQPSRPTGHHAFFLHLPRRINALPSNATNSTSPLSYAEIREASHALEDSFVETRIKFNRSLSMLASVRLCHIGIGIVSRMRPAPQPDQFVFSSPRSARKFWQIVHNLHKNAQSLHLRKNKNPKFPPNPRICAILVRSPAQKPTIPVRYRPLPPPLLIRVHPCSSVAQCFLPL